MATKGSRSKLDHETKTRRHKALEVPRLPARCKTHWDYVLEEMIWLSKDFEAERKWKLAQAKKVALRAGRGMMDHASKGERKIKEEEQRLRKVAINISKDVKKFWVKIEKLVLYKYQMELDEKKKKALDKQLEFLLGQTERYSTMLAENLLDKPSLQSSLPDLPISPFKEEDKYDPGEHEELDIAQCYDSDVADCDDDYDRQSADESVDDEQTIEEDEAFITEEERKEELKALHDEIDLPIEDLLRRYATDKVYTATSLEPVENGTKSTDELEVHEKRGVCLAPGARNTKAPGHGCVVNNGSFPISKILQIVEGDAQNLSNISGEPAAEFVMCSSNVEEEPDGNVHLSGGLLDCEMNNGDKQQVHHKGNHCMQVELLVQNEGNADVSRESESEIMIADATAAARSAQPTGNTFSTTNVRTKFPFLLKYPLREYQHIGLDWLVSLNEKRLNGILADEMGLGKTIMTIALLAHLACEKGAWGPHLIVVPTSVMLNWETEFLKWCPAFKILTYFGSSKERKLKRQGWMKPNSFHVCITTYRLVIQDSKVFKRKKWKYLILDEAHLIKNWKSQRWQTLLNFSSKRRILLTGTPLQNDLMELWSLMHFLMPHVFQSHQEFKDWFSTPISGMVEGQERVNKVVVDRLHNVLRPFILRRLKRDVEKQLPLKQEHIIYCRLSRRQRNLYEDFIASSETQATLASANFFGMISIIMQLRKVCNHPDLFEGRSIISSFDMTGIDMQLPSSACFALHHGPFDVVNLFELGLLFTHWDFTMTSWQCEEVQAISTPSELMSEHCNLDDGGKIGDGFTISRKFSGTNIFEEVRKALLEERRREAKERAASAAWWNVLRCREKPVYSTNLRDIIEMEHPVYDINSQEDGRISWMYSSKLADVVLSPFERFHRMMDLVESFMFSIPAARALAPVCWCSKTGSPMFMQPEDREKCSEILLPLFLPIRPAIVRRQVYFPDRRLIQFDCGKLQELAILLRRLKSEGHRALIFTQMTKMLDILEAFINLYGYSYMRLDGSTQPEERQTLMQRFNTNPKFFLFILSTRSGGVGINLIGADTVIFYDSDWNPAMDQQAQDRCHRIGQMREVHIYRLISESTIEENILKKAKQKRALDDLVIQSGSYNTDFFKKLDPMELFLGHEVLKMNMEGTHNSGDDASLSNADVEAALKYVEDEADYMALKKAELEEAVDNQEFTEETVEKFDDDEFLNDDEAKADENAVQDMIKSDISNIVDLNSMISLEDRAAESGRAVDNADMMVYVKATSPFENQLRPIDRYAMRFLELWDPIVDKAAVEPQVAFDEREWELDCIEKYKDEMEAETDEDDESFLYERWDADFATEAYRQQVEILAQHQLMKEKEAQAYKEDANGAEFDTMMNETSSSARPRSKKKPKKGSLKSQKKASFRCDLKHAEEEPSADTMSIDDKYKEVNSSDSMPFRSGVKKRRRGTDSISNDEGAKSLDKKPKILRSDSMERHPCNQVVPGTGLDLKQGGRRKTGGKMLIPTMPGKRVIVIKPEKLKKGNFWSRECVSHPDSWLSQEDAILCAAVHEYGPHWSLVSETLYGMTSGGRYRGRYRHPVHCCERFKELFQRHVLASAETHVNEKANSSIGSAKALLKVTEDNLRLLLHVVSELPNREFLLQKHFAALLSSVRKFPSSATECRETISALQNGYYFGGSRKEPPKRMRYSHLKSSSRCVAAAVCEASACLAEDASKSNLKMMHNLPATERLEVTLEFQNNEDGDSLFLFPPIISVSIPCSQFPSVANLGVDQSSDHIRVSAISAENRLRDTTRVWSVELEGDEEFHPVFRPQPLGKHNASVSSSASSSRPSGSKLKRTSIGPGEISRPSPDLVGRPFPNLWFDFCPMFPRDNCYGELDANPLSFSDMELSTEPQILEPVLFSDEHGLISGLDNYSVLPDYTDLV